MPNKTFDFELWLCNSTFTCKYDTIGCVINICRSVQCEHSWLL